MISTGVQLKAGKTYGNLMVDVKRSNIKLVNRARLIFKSVLEPIEAGGVELGVDLTDNVGIDKLIDECGGSVKLAMVVARWSCSVTEATDRLDKVDGLLKKAL